MKRCTKCQTERALTEFYVRYGKPLNYCKPCVRAQSKAWREANPERHRETLRRNYQDKREIRLQQNREWRQRNPERVRAAKVRDRPNGAARSRRWRQQNPEWAKRISSERYQTHKDEAREYGREWKRRNPGRSATNLREWRKRNPERHQAIVHRRRAIKRSLDWGDVTPEAIQRLFDSFGGLCAYCMTAPAKHVDHFVPLKLGGLHAVENLLPACVSCNTSKGAKRPDEWLNQREKV